MSLDNELWSNVVDKIKIDENATFLEFGVASGNTMCAMLNNLTRRGIKPRKVVGFDAFLGLPEEDATVDRHESWVAGAFNLADEIKNNSQIETKPDENNNPIEILTKRFSKYAELYGINVELVQGWYNELDVWSVEKFDIKPACFIHIDCDLYISAIQCLRWLAKNKLFGPNCLVRYDDWNIEGKGLYTCGESRAHKEICERYGLVFDYVESNGHAAELFRYKGLKDDK